MVIVVDDPSYLPDLIRLNEQWISHYFTIEAVDRELARDPAKIVREGGHVFSAVDTRKVVGVAALFRTSTHSFELARMAVAEARRGEGIGRALANAALQRARDAGADCVTLLSNTRLEAAIALYRSLGFVAVSEKQHAEYARCNICMRLELR